MTYPIPSNLLAKIYLDWLGASQFLRNTLEGYRYTDKAHLRGLKIPLAQVDGLGSYSRRLIA